MSENIVDINSVRRVRNMEKAVKVFENQLAALKKSTQLLAEHKDFRFFSITCHELAAETKKIAEDLIKLRIRLHKAKEQLQKEI